MKIDPYVVPIIRGPDGSIGLNMGGFYRVVDKEAIKGYRRGARSFLLKTRRQEIKRIANEILILKRWLFTMSVFFLLAVMFIVFGGHYFQVK